MSVKNNQLENNPRPLSTGATPNVNAGQGAFYVKDVSGIAEGFYVDDQGNEIQLTSNGAINVPITGEANTASNVGTGSGDVFKQKTGVDLEFRKIKAGSNVTVAIVGDDIEISTPASTGETNTASNVGTGNQIFKQKTGTDLEFRTLKAGSNVTIVSSLDEITISAAGGGGASLQVQDEGGLVDNAVSTLNFTGAGVTASQTSPGVVQIAVSSGGSGETNTASNLGAGEGVFSLKSGVDLQFKSLVAGTNVSLASDANTITINAAGAAGETNTASNQGAGAGVFKQKTGVDLELRSLIGGVGLLQTQNINDVTIDLDINSLTAEASLDGAADFVVVYDTSATAHRKVLLNNLPGGGGGESNTASNQGAGAGVFKQKTGVDLELRSIIGGEGLAQTQNTDDVTVNLDVNSLTTDATPDGAADYVVTYDASASSHKKVLLNDLPGGGGGGSNLFAEFSFTVSGGGSISARTVTGLPAGWKIGDGTGAAMTGSPAMDAVSAELSTNAADLIIQHGETKNMIEFICVSLDPSGPPFGLGNNIVDFTTGGANQTFRTESTKAQSHIKAFQTDLGSNACEIYVRFL